MARYETLDDFQRDLDESERFSDDPFGTDPGVGLLDDEDLEALGFKPKKKRRATPAD